MPSVITPDIGVPVSARSPLRVDVVVEEDLLELRLLVLFAVERDAAVLRDVALVVRPVDTVPELFELENVEVVEVFELVDFEPAAPAPAPARAPNAPSSGLTSLNTSRISCGLDIVLVARVSLFRVISLTRSSFLIWMDLFL